MVAALSGGMVRVDEEHSTLRCTDENVVKKSPFTGLLLENVGRMRVTDLVPVMSSAPVVRLVNVGERKVRALFPAEMCTRDSLHTHSLSTFEELAVNTLSADCGVVV